MDKVFGIKYHDSFINKVLYTIFLVIGYKKFSFVSKPVSRIFNFFGISIIEENDDYDFKPEYLRPARGIKFYVGGWHSEKYFIDIKDTILQTFQFNFESIGNDNLAVLNQIKTSNSVSIHVRRGDFMASDNYGKLGAVCTLNYFLVAIKKMESLVENPQFFLFTNDHSWVRENFKEPRFTIIDINTSNNSWKDMFLISNCSNHIDSNGSFSWWSSWLNRNHFPYVIVPKNFIANRYFKDIYPESWIQIADY